MHIYRNVCVRVCQPVAKSVDSSERIELHSDLRIKIMFKMSTIIP